MQMFRVDSDCTTRTFSQEVLEVHARVDSHPGVNKIILETVSWITTQERGRKLRR
jgi:hypothetical protein